MGDMSTSSDLLRKLLVAHLKGDDGGFRKVAWQVVEKERRINHHVFANDLERILLGIDDENSKSLFMRRVNNDLPKDKDRNADLIELIEPKRHLEQLVLSEEVAHSLRRIISERKKADLLNAHGIRSISKILFCGPPGCGKTFAAEALASALYLPLAIVRFDAVVSSYLGETASNLRRVFEFARSRPCVLFFDEFDAIGKHRTSEDEHGELKRVVNSFLQMLDGFHSDALTVAATNHQGLLDSALWRRFDEIIMFPMPDHSQIEEMFVRQFHQLGIQKSIRLPSIAKTLVGLSHADIEHIAKDAIKHTLMESEKEISSQTLTTAISRQLSRLRIVQNKTSPLKKSKQKKGSKKKRSQR